MDAQSTPRPASCLCDVARVFTKHLSAEVRDGGVEFSVQNPMCDLLCSPHSPLLWRPLQVSAALKKRACFSLILFPCVAGGGVPGGKKVGGGAGASASRPSTSGPDATKGEGVRPRFFVGGRVDAGNAGNGHIHHGQYKDQMLAESVLQRARARDKEISGAFPDLGRSKTDEEREHVYDQISDCIIPGTAKPDGRKLLNEMHICLGLNKISVPLNDLLSRQTTKGEKAMEMEKNMRRGGKKEIGKWQMKVSERPWDPPKRHFRAMLKNPM